MQSGVKLIRYIFLEIRMVIILFLEIKSTFMANTIGDGKLLMVTVINLHLSTKLTGKMKLKDILITERF